MKNIHKLKTIEEAIQTLQQFLECDLYSKFRPEEKINGEVWVRDDPFKNKLEFHKYIEEHFEILRKQIKELNPTQSKPRDEENNK